MVRGLQLDLFRIEDKLFETKGGAQAWLAKRRRDIDRTGGGYMGETLLPSGRSLWYAEFYFTDVNSGYAV